MVLFCLLVDSLDKEEARSLGQRLTLSRKKLEIVKNYQEGLDNIEDLKDANKNSEIFRTVSKFAGKESLLALRARFSGRLAEKIRKYQDDLSAVEPLIGGDDLIRWGMEPGPELGELLNELFLMQLDMKAPDREKLKQHLQYEHPELEVD